MKNITCNLAALAAVLLSLAGCRDGELPNNFYLNVAPNTAQSVVAAATSFNFIVGTNVAWEVYVNGDLKHSGTPGENQTWQLTMPANESTADAVVYSVLFKSADLAYEMEITVRIIQAEAAEAPYLRVDPSTDQNVGADVTSFDFAVGANVSWIVKVDGQQQDSGVGDKAVTVTFPANEDTSAPATRTVVFESADPAYEMEITVRIIQAGAAEVPYLRVDPSSDQNVGADVTSFEFAVGANVSWTVKVDGGQQDSGSGDKSVTVTFPANEDISAPATRTVVFESADPAYSQNYAINIVQAKKPAAAVTYTETFNGFTTGSTNYAGTGNYTSTEVTGVVWSYLGATNQGNAKFILGRHGGGNTNDGFVKTNTVPGGVSYIAVDWILPFNDGSGSYNGSSFKVMVGAQEVGRHTVAKGDAAAGVKGTLVIEDLDIKGDAVISIESDGAGRPGINKVVWKTNP